MQGPFSPTANRFNFKSLSDYVESDDIRYRKIDGCGVVLDLQTQRYSVLDDLASAAWEVFTGQVDAATYVDQWAHEYDATPDEIASTIDRLCADCLRMGWLRRKDAVACQKLGRRTSWFPNWCGRLPNRLLAFWALTFTALSLELRGFSKTYRRQRELLKPSGQCKIPPLEPVIRPFLAAENVVVFRRAPNDCLVRSLALFRYLCWLGIPATHIIGIRRVPFMAHAWVEVSGEGVLAPVPRGFSALATLTSTC
jgi:hypothetical protein